jgi:hypothetical protein
MSTDDNIVSYFQRHVIPVYFSFQKEGDIQRLVVSTFVLSVSDQWFLITAGHCIQEIQKLIDCGYELTQCLLIDSLGEGAKHAEPIPFMYKESNPIWLSDDFAFDYGVIALSPYYKKLLLTNNVQALNEEVWKKQPNQVDFYTLLGIPAELVKVNSDNIELVPSLHTVKPVDKKPDGFSEVDTPLFYGQIVLGEGLESIAGMSGGPVFAFQKNEKGELRYWLTALQSRWLPEAHFIAACPTKLLGQFLEDVYLQASISK